MENAEISALVESELFKIKQPELLALGRNLVVKPRLELRPWDYGKVGEKYPCWVALEHQPSNTTIVYCSQGFGPQYPWGLLFISGQHMSMGMDSQWFTSLEDALRGSIAWEGKNPEGYEVQ